MMSSQIDRFVSLLSTNVHPCQLKPLDRNDDDGPGFSDAQWAELQAVFPKGVCDCSKPGVQQRPTIPWLTYQDDAEQVDPGRVIYGGEPMPPRPLAAGWASPAFTATAR